MKKVLVVDDSHITRLMIKAIIENAFQDWQVDLAEDAREAVTQCEAGDYDFITLDMNMPGRDGLSVAPALMDACPNARIALLTSNQQERVKELASQQGLIFIPKPVTEDKLTRFFKSLI